MGSPKQASGKGASAGVIKENPGGNTRSEPMPLVKSILSVEPSMLIHMGAGMLVYMTVQDVLLEKACRSNLSFSDEVCDALQARKTEGYEKEEQAVQALMGQAVMWRTFLENAFPIFLVFLVGAWSDKYGRKYPMVLVIAAYMLQDILLILALNAGKVVGMWTITILSSVVVSLSGNQACMISAAFSYTSDHTPAEKRTLRTAITHSLIFLGITLGLAACGITSKMGFSFTKVFTIGLALETFALVYLLISMKNNPLPGVTKGKTVMQMFMELFNFQHMIDAGKCIFKKREGNTRLKLLLLLLTHACVFMPMMGELSVLYLFCIRQFSWTAGTFGGFMSYKTILGFLGNFVSMGILGGWMKLNDMQNGIVACVANVVANIFLSAASTDFAMMLGPTITLLSGALMIVPRSMLSKTVPSEDLGKINSCIGSMESVLPFVASSVYTTVYTSFIDVYPGSFFLITVALMIPPIIIYLWFMQNETDAAAKKKK